MNLLNALYHSDGVSVPVDYRLIRKPLPFCDVATRRLKRASEVTKNELLQEMFLQALRNQLVFRDVLMESWFASKDHFELILSKNKHFVAVLKDNRLVALSQADKAQGRFVRVDSLQLADKQAVRGWLKGFEHEVLLVGRVLTNKDGSTGRLSLVCSDLTCDGERVAELHQKRWKVELAFKRLKSLLDLDTLRTQQHSLLGEVWIRGKWLDALVIERRAQRHATGGIDPLDRPRRLIPWRLLIIVRQEVDHWMLDAQHWCAEQWDACLDVLKERPRRRRLQTVPPRVMQMMNSQVSQRCGQVGAYGVNTPSRIKATLTWLS